jgi:hypothetical protein
MDNMDNMDNMDKQYEIVVASYKEPMDWLDYLPKSEDRPFKLTISNSAGFTDFSNVDKVINIENSGREAGHYLRFIIDNYDDLLPITVFIQGDPWAHHTFNMVNLLQYFYGSPPFKKDVQYLGCSETHTLGASPVSRYSPSGYVLSLGWRDLPIPSPIPFAVGAQFYVKKETILKRPKDHYERIYSAKDAPDLSLAHALEANWGSVFAP